MEVLVRHSISTSECVSPPQYFPIMITNNVYIPVINHLVNSHIWLRILHISKIEKKASHSYLPQPHHHEVWRSIKSMYDCVILPSHLAPKILSSYESLCYLSASQAFGLDFWPKIQFIPQCLPNGIYIRQSNRKNVQHALGSGACHSASRTSCVDGEPETGNCWTVRFSIYIDSIFSQGMIVDKKTVAAGEGVLKPFVHGYALMARVSS